MKTTNRMKTSIEHAWASAADKAASSPPPSGGFVLFRVDERSDKSCFGGVDSEGNNLLAIEVKAQPPLIEIGSAALDYFRHERKGLQAWLMVFRLKSEKLIPVFGRLCQDLIDEIEGVGTEQALLGVVQRRISLWKKLFANGPDGLLADFQIKGLLAELLFMESQLAEAVREPLDIAYAWLGPSGGDQDFVFSDAAIEVKAIGPHSEGVSISTLQQLDSPLPLTLMVWTMRAASADQPKAETLDGVIARIEQMVAPVPQALVVFRAALLEAGYVSHPRYTEVAFEPMGFEAFSVGENFPRLTSSSVPEGVESAVYVLSLETIRTGI